MFLTDNTQIKINGYTTWFSYDIYLFSQVCTTYQDKYTKKCILLPFFQMSSFEFSSTVHRIKLVIKYHIKTNVE